MPQADLAQKKPDNDRAQQLFAKDEFSAQERDLAATALKRAEAIFKAAQQRYNEAEEGSRKEDIAIARANLDRGQRQPRPLAHQPELHRSARSFHRRDHGAPGGTGRSGRARLSGGHARRSRSHLAARLYCRNRPRQIHWGQEATITTDTYPGKQYHGRISFISPNAEFTPKSVQTYKERVTLVYRIKIDIDNPNHELKPGMPADAHIELAAAASKSNQPQAMTEQTPIRDRGRGLTKSFPGVRAVDGLSFDVHAGEIFGLVGPDGAGKTTTLRMLAGIMPPDAGKATVAGFDVVAIRRAPSTLSVICRSASASTKT